MTCLSGQCPCWCHEGSSARAEPAELCLALGQAWEGRWRRWSLSWGVPLSPGLGRLTDGHARYLTPAQSRGEGAGRGVSQGQGHSPGRELSVPEGSAVTEPRGEGEGSASGHNAGTGFGRRATGSEAWQGLRRPCKPRRYRGVRLSVLGLPYQSAQTRRLGTAESTTSALWPEARPAGPGAALPTPLRGGTPACHPALGRPPRPSASFCIPALSSIYMSVSVSNLPLNKDTGHTGPRPTLRPQV